MEAERKSKSNKLKLTPRSIGFPSHSMDGVWSEGTDTRNHRVPICYGTSLEGSEKKREPAAQVRSENSGYARPRTKTNPRQVQPRAAEEELTLNSTATTPPRPVPSLRTASTAAPWPGRAARGSLPEPRRRARRDGRAAAARAKDAMDGWWVSEVGEERESGERDACAVQCAERRKGVGMVI